ncbi:MAG TPA: hypothetical protein VMX17_10025 [Candidatus Glassbacteria bacterium]|nr:hypothetical protein [Candidatus Glassbacteria bacterium]
MANNTISSEQLEKLLEVNSKSIELNTVVHSQFEDITEELKNIKVNQKEIKASNAEIDKRLFRLNIILGSNFLALLVGLIILVIKLLLGVP